MIELVDFIIQENVPGIAAKYCASIRFVDDCSPVIQTAAGAVYEYDKTVTAKGEKMSVITEGLQLMFNEVVDGHA